MSNKKKIALFSRYGRLGASSRLRFFQFLPELENEFEVTVFPLFGDEYLQQLYEQGHSSKLYIIKRYIQRVKQLLSVRHYDAVWIEKELFPYFPSWGEGLLSLMKRPYIVDYDDAIFHNYDLTTNPIKKLLSMKIDNVMRSATLVTAGNKYLADRAMKAGALQVEQVPTVIDISRYEVKTDYSTDHFIIGWIGSPTTSKYLVGISSVLQDLAKEYPFSLRVIGADVDIFGVDVICTSWKEASEVAEIQKFDIGIMPLVDSPWERGKCGYKLIQYMACGIPVIASPVGVNTEIVEGSSSGFLATDNLDWLVYFRKLLLDSKLRKELGGNGRKAVKSTYSVQKIAPKLINLINKTVKGEF